MKEYKCRVNLKDFPYSKRCQAPKKERIVSLWHPFLQRRAVSFMDGSLGDWGLRPGFVADVLPFNSGSILVILLGLFLRKKLH